MKARNLLLLSLLGALAACQPEKTPAPETQAGAAAPAQTAPMAQPAEQPVATAPAAEPAPAASAQATEPKPAAKTEPVIKPETEKPKTAAVATPAITTKTQQASALASTATQASTSVLVSPSTQASTSPHALITPPPAAVAMPAEAAKCKLCHAIDKKSVGPSWKDVAAKRNGDKVVILANIKKGGKLGWGMGNMPPNGTESDAAKLEKLAEFIAGLK